MWKIWSLVLCICFLLSGNCFAMQFSQPIEIGQIGTILVGGGVSVKSAFYNNGSQYNKKNDPDRYGKGIAGFGEKNNALYVRYDYYNERDIFYFGDKDKNNTIEDKFLHFKLYEINTNEGINIYLLYKSYGPEADYLIIGKKDDGRFIKYIDTKEITRRYFGWDGTGVSPIVYLDIYTQGNTLIVPYYHLRNNKSRGEFRFKWDDKAQWFGVEQIIN